MKAKTNNILFFDTETTGISKESHLVQVAWILMNLDREIINANEYIIYPDGYEIPANASAIHGITTKKAQNEGVDLEIVLKQFTVHASWANVIVGHNVNFDFRIMQTAYKNASMDFPLDNKTKVDTMTSSTQWCKLPKANGRGYKWPKLEELYYKLFNEHFDNAHSAIADTKATMTCYFKLVDLGVIKGPNLNSLSSQAQLPLTQKASVNNQEDGSKYRRHVSRYEDGQKKEDGYIYNGKKDGKFTWWYEDGQKKQEHQYDDGKRDGKSTFWYENGQKEEEGYFKNDKLEGKFTRWYEDGQKDSEGSYKNSEQDGEWKYWYQNGQKSSTQEYQDDELHGKYVGWYATGQMNAKGSYLNGNKEGRWNHWHTNGQKEAIQNHKEGQLHGKTTKWNTRGKKIEEVHYQDGHLLLDGLQTSYSDNGTKIEKRYKKGSAHGKWIWWYGNGQKSAQENYKDGNPFGRWTYWYLDGQKREEWDYENGKVHYVTKWNEHGQIVQQGHFKNGEIKN
jgi:antitoxin component YwqK of YwqJK toxin-antitoxin module